MSAREWKGGDRCRTNWLGDWRNGTIESFSYSGTVVVVRRDGENTSRAFLTLTLRKPVDE